MKKLLFILVVAASLFGQTTSVGNTVNIGNAGPVAKDSTLTGGAAKAITRGGAKGSTLATDVTSTPSGVNHQGLDVIFYDGAGSILGLASNPIRVDPTGTTTQPVSIVNWPGTQQVSATSLPLPTGAAQEHITANSPDACRLSDGASFYKPTTPADTQPVSAISLPLPSGAAQDRTTAASPASVRLTDGTTFYKGTTPSDTQPVSVTSLPLPTGAATSANQPALKSDNAGAPGASNEGVLPAVANAAPPARTEGNQAAVSVDLHGNLRVYGHPPDVVGCYMVNGRTPTYSGLTAGAPLFSVRWGDSTHLMVIMRIRINVATTAASTSTSGAAEREAVIARSFTVSDSGGTAVTLTGNNQKMRTSFGTSLISDMRFGGPLTAGTRTLDANPVASALAWLAPNFTGVDIGCGGAAATAAAWACTGGMGPVDLLNATNGQDYPIVLAQNEGLIIRIGKDAQPTGFTQQTYVNMSWCEVNAY